MIRKSRREILRRGMDVTNDTEPPLILSQGWRGEGGAPVYTESVSIPPSCSHHPPSFWCTSIDWWQGAIFSCCFGWQSICWSPWRAANGRPWMDSHPTIHIQLCGKRVKAFKTIKSPKKKWVSIKGSIDDNAEFQFQGSWWILCSLFH